MEKSPPFSLNSLDYQKLLKDAGYFFLIPFSFYIIALIERIGTPNHILSLVDFVPSNTTNVAIVLWLLNQMLNAIRKYVS